MLVIHNNGMHKKLVWCCTSCIAMYHIIAHMSFHPPCHHSNILYSTVNLFSLADWNLCVIYIFLGLLYFGWHWTPFRNESPVPLNVSNIIFVLKSLCIHQLRFLCTVIRHDYFPLCIGWNFHIASDRVHRVSLHPVASPVMSSSSYFAIPSILSLLNCSKF